MNDIKFPKEYIDYGGLYPLQYCMAFETLLNSLIKQGGEPLSVISRGRYEWKFDIDGKLISFYCDKLECLWRPEAGFYFV